MIYGTAFTVTSSANATIVATTDSARFDQRYVLQNNGTAVVTLGHASSGTAGYPLATGQSTPVLLLEQGEALFGFVAAGTADLRLLGITGSR